MYATDITFGLFIVFFTILLLRWVRKPRLQLSGFRSQRICPSCGLITSRLRPRCLECGKPLTTME
jgi:predicted amidophosphoribosyltransferase